MGVRWAERDIDCINQDTDTKKISSVNFFTKMISFIYYFVLEARRFFYSYFGSIKAIPWTAVLLLRSKIRLKFFFSYGWFEIEQSDKTRDRLFCVLSRVKFSKRRCQQVSISVSLLLQPPNTMRPNNFLKVAFLYF